MTREQLFEAMVGIDEDRLEQSEKKRKKSFRWIRFGAVAACIGLIGLAANNFFISSLQKDEYLGVRSQKSEMQIAGNFESQNGKEMGAAGGEIQEDFFLNGLWYTPINHREELSIEGVQLYSEQRKENVESAKEDISLEDQVVLSESDLGERMGVIEESENQELIGCTVYHDIRYPDSDQICIVKKGNFYQLYGVEKETEWESLDVILAEYYTSSASIQLQLPSDWEYEIKNSGQRYGIRFWPKEEMDFKLDLLYWETQIGMCGTGVTIEEVIFSNGMKATQYTEKIEGILWFTMIYQDLPGTYVVSGQVPEELWEKYKTVVMEILETAELGKE